VHQSSGRFVGSGRRCAAVERNRTIALVHLFMAEPPTAYASFVFLFLSLLRLLATAKAANSTYQAEYGLPSLHSNPNGIFQVTFTFTFTTLVHKRAMLVVVKGVCGKGMDCSRWDCGVRRLSRFFLSFLQCIYGYRFSLTFYHRYPTAEDITSHSPSHVLVMGGSIYPME